MAARLTIASNSVRIKLGRREAIKRGGWSGKTHCGCVYYECSLWAPCDKHLENMTLYVGRHRNATV